MSPNPAAPECKGKLGG